MSKLQPSSSPSAWASYAESSEVKAVPLRDLEELHSEARIQTTRAIYLAYPAVVKSGYTKVRLFAEGISLEANTVVDLESARETLLCSRALVSDQDVMLDFILPTDPKKDSLVTIFADSLAHGLSYSVRDTACQGRLPWGSGSGAKEDCVGVQLYFEAGSKAPEIIFMKTYRDALPSVQFLASLETQLRVALILSWIDGPTAVQQVAYIAKVSSKVSGKQLMNLQAVQLGQQLAATSLAGPNMNYAPVLTMNRYEATAQAFIEAADGYESQYDRFLDQSKAADDRIAAWTNMIDREVALSNMRKDATAKAKAKYEDAIKVVDSLEIQAKDVFALRDARSELVVGIEAWKRDAKLKAAFQIISAVVDFALSIAEMCVGVPPKIPVDGIVQSVEAIDKAAQGVKLAATSFENLSKCIDSINKLWPTIKEASENIEMVEEGKVDQVTTISDATAKGAVDAGSIGAVAAWDKWILDSDQQLEFPVSQGIAGASKYRLELRKHAVDGKALTQAKVETIKAGQEYVTARLEQSLAEYDLKKLKELKDHWTVEKQEEDQAAVRLFDRLLSIRTSIVMEMRNIVWAYKYNALEDSIVALSNMKRTADYRQDMAVILEENNTYLTKYPRPYRIQEPQYVKNIPELYRDKIIQSLKESPHSATFAFAPSTSRSKDLLDTAGSFNDGEHFRINSLQVYLIGAVPQAGHVDHSNGDFQLRISTSGVYADVRNGKVFNFIAKPIKDAHFNYSEVSGNRMIRENSFDASLDASKDFAPPTPFTQWTVSIHNADELDLDNLTDLELQWDGFAYPLSN